jgi:hypothetical protein
MNLLLDRPLKSSERVTAMPSPHFVVVGAITRKKVICSSCGKVKGECERWGEYPYIIITETIALRIER